MPGGVKWVLVVLLLALGVVAAVILTRDESSEDVISSASLAGVEPISASAVGAGIELGTDHEDADWVSEILTEVDGHWYVGLLVRGENGALVEVDGAGTVVDVNLDADFSEIVLGSE